jgi:hypothetical protein
MNVGVSISAVNAAIRKINPDSTKAIKLIFAMFFIVMLIFIKNKLLLQIYEINFIFPN